MSVFVQAIIQLLGVQILHLGQAGQTVKVSQTGKAGKVSQTGKAVKVSQGEPADATSDSDSVSASVSAPDPAPDSVSASASATDSASAKQLKHLVGELAELLEVPPRLELGHYALPCFGLARIFKKSPVLIAQQLAQLVAKEIAQQPLLAKVVAEGPYLNFWVRIDQMAQISLPAVLDESMFAQPQSTTQIMVEYSQPNTHKGFHVGHMRNVALGDALSRLLTYRGYAVIAANYIGDVGAHIARCLWMMENRARLAPELSQELSLELSPQPAKSADPHLRGEWLGEIYTAAASYLEQASPAEQQRCRLEIGQVLKKLTAELVAGQGHYYQLWQETRQWSLEAFNEIYQWLGAHFDTVFYESELEELGRKMVAEYFLNGKLIRSDGAIGINLADQDDQQNNRQDSSVSSKELGFFMLLKADGNTLYATKDLALAQLKFEKFGLNRSIYVVGAEQSFYFKQLFAALKQLGWQQASHCEHLSYGLVTLPQGKMSSRAGNVVLFSKLRKEMNAYINVNYIQRHKAQWSASEIAETTRLIAVAAIRYQMIKHDADKPLLFDLKAWLVSEGDTGVYLCYAIARLNSLLKHAQQKELFPSASANFATLVHPLEHALIRQIHNFNLTTERAAKQLKIPLLANALFQLTKDFHRFYAALPILSAPPELRLARLTLVATTQKILLKGLQMLGITPPQRM